MKTAGWRRAFRRSTRAPADDGAAARRDFFDRARSMTEYVSVDVNGLTFVVATGDRLGRGLFVRRWRQDLGHLARAVRILGEHGLFRAGATFVDVGANIGTTTVEAVRRQGFGHAVAIEPEPRNFRLLRLNVAANEVESQVTALQAAAADREGDLQLAVSARSSGEHALDPIRLDKSAATLTVPGVTVDGLVERGVIRPGEVGLLWIDAHGAEGLVLEGASSLLERDVPVVTALRPELSNWTETRASLTRLLGRYTGFADLRHGARPPVADLAQLTDSLSENGDVLAFRR